MSDKPLVSVLMTSYNCEAYIDQAIQSVLNSTYNDFELIIVDDNSSDATFLTAKKYESLDSRVRVFRNSENLGDYKNRNRASTYAEGKYIKYIDSDDYIYPWGLEVLINMIEAFPSAGWGLCSLEQNIENPFPLKLQPDEIYEYHYFGPGLFHKAPLSSIIKRSIFEEAGGFSGKQHLGDFEFWHILAKSYPVVLMPYGIVWHRIHSTQQSAANRNNPLVPLKYTVSALHFFKNDVSIPLNKDQISIIKTKLEKEILLVILKCLVKFRLRMVISVIRMYLDTNLCFGKKERVETN